MKVIKANNYNFFQRCPQRPWRGSDFIVHRTQCKEISLLKSSSSKKTRQSRNSTKKGMEKKNFCSRSKSRPLTELEQNPHPLEYSWGHADSPILSWPTNTLYLTSVKCRWSSSVLPAVLVLIMSFCGGSPSKANHDSERVTSPSHSEEMLPILFHADYWQINPPPIFYSSINALNKEWLLKHPSQPCTSNFF